MAGTELTVDSTYRRIEVLLMAAAFAACLISGAYHKGFPKRCPLRLMNFSIWELATPEELHEVLQSLPMYPFMTITVTPIIKHPVEQAYEDKYGSMPALL